MSNRLKIKLPPEAEPPITADSSAEHSKLRINRANAAKYVGKTAAAHESELSIKELLPGVQGAAKEIVPLPNVSASLYVDAAITGPWHYSFSKLSKFEQDKASKSGGKFGDGVYLGVGGLGGETVNLLKAKGAIKHDVAFNGNLLVLDRADIKEAETTLQRKNGIPESSVKINTNNANLTALVSNQSFEGHGVDAVMVYMDEDRTSAEIAVLPRSVECIDIR